MSGTTKKLQLLGKLQSSVYILSEGETLEDAPIDADVVIDPYSDEAVFPEGGSGGAQSDWNAAEGEPGHVLNRPFYSDYGIGTVLAECNPVFAEDEGMFVLTDAVQPLIIDKEYTVNWNGTEYACVAEEYSEEGVVFGMMLGNTSVVGGTQENETPFVIVIPYEAIEGLFALILPLDGSTQLVLSITGEVETITPVPKKYLSELRGQKKIVINKDANSNTGTANVLSDVAEAMDIDELASNMVVVDSNGLEYPVISVIKNNEVQVGMEYTEVVFVACYISSASDINQTTAKLLFGKWFLDRVIFAESMAPLPPSNSPYGYGKVLTLTNAGHAIWDGPDDLLFRSVRLKSSTPGSYKEFKVTVDDSGTLTATAI